MSDLTHAYVGYNRDGATIMVFVDDASKECARECAGIIAAGGRIERMTIEQAREAATQMFKKPVPK